VAFQVKISLKDLVIISTKTQMMTTTPSVSHLMRKSFRSRKKKKRKRSWTGKRTNRSKFGRKTGLLERDVFAR
jgi:hypothetical protein